MYPKRTREKPKKTDRRGQ
uniref:Uncharacterized protein n=1 Tax=Anguilla anguilla TaxID=7936 RepID=A0A0E9T536_ANGAN